MLHHHVEATAYAFLSWLPLNSPNLNSPNSQLTEFQLAEISTHRNPNSPNLTSDWSTSDWFSLLCHIDIGYTSKVTSLQALLRKTFRSGVLVLGDFG